MTQQPIRYPLPTVSPEDHEQNIWEVAQEFADRFKATLMQVWEEGYFVFRHAPPVRRHASYMVMTLPDELGMLLDPEYMNKLEAGLAVPPRSVMIRDTMRPPIVDEVTGLEQFAMKEGNRWHTMFALPKWFVRMVLADFREVHGQAEKRAEQA